ncbi:hypothetical protein CJ030_MR0G006362 [Morella rubra]|uniref:Uncharacterized protein n=1 Tax=Morella rubra TaxID=262757 RepID=A0A6A1UKT4_9ROSI|nr:hypothetical protein CJ030_MR0G006362 [Morella rubra]
MQAGSVLSLSPSFHLHSPARGYSEVAAQVMEDLRAKMNLEDFGTESEMQENEGISKAEALDQNLGDEQQREGENDEEKESDDEDFSFACPNVDGSPISADDMFDQGQIRPVFPLFNRELLFSDAYDGDLKDKDASSSPTGLPLRKLFVEERDIPSSSASESDDLEGVPEGTYCEWSGKGAVKSAPREVPKKSNSTGFSKLWRFRELVPRSNSDGHDAFVFLSPSANAKPRSETTTVKKNDNVEKKEKTRVVVEEVKPKAARGVKTASSAHERHYLRNKALREGDKRRSYLPYRQDLVGFFTNVNGLSRNVHPF